MEAEIAVAESGAERTAHDAGAAWEKLSRLLIDASTQHAVRTSEGDRETFCRRVQEAVKELRDRPSASKILIAAGSLTHAIEHYNRQTQDSVDQRLRAMHEVVESLVAHIEAANAKSANRSRLTELRQEWSRVAGQDLKKFPERLRAGLEDAASENRRMEQESRLLLDTLRDRITVLEQSAAAPAQAANTAGDSPASPVDATTGLPMRPQAEIAIQRALANAAEGLYVVVFYVHRMNLTNARFGESIGNQVILHCSQHISTRLLRAGEVLYRWMGPAFVALLERKGSEQSVIGEVSRITSAPLNRFFETSSRTVYLPMKVSGEPILAEGRAWAEVSDQIQQFILRASHNLD